MKKPPPRGIRLWAVRFGKAIRIALKPLTVVNNFVLFTVAYFLGVGLSALGLRFSRRKPGTESSATYWVELPAQSRSRERWQRPF